MNKYTVLWDDNTVTFVEAWDTSEAWEKALDTTHAGKIVDVWCE